MWTSALDSAGGFFTALALLLTAIGTLALALQKLFRPSDKDKKAAKSITTGQEIRPEPDWLIQLRRRAARADTCAEEREQAEAEVVEGREREEVLRTRLDKARFRLAVNMLPYEDI